MTQIPEIGPFCGIVNKKITTNFGASRTAADLPDIRSDTRVCVFLLSNLIFDIRSRNIEFKLI